MKNKKIDFFNLKEKIIDVNQIQIGDWVLVRPGEKIPIDGLIIEGESSIDESMITGESVPVDKKKGDWVIAGTINRQGKIIIETKKIGQQTMLSQIINLVRQTQMTKPPIQKLADLIASYFVPIVIFLSIVTFVFWFLKGSLTLALLNSISVLIIACPCALGLATSIVITVALGKSAKYGILIKDSSVFEVLSKTKDIVFDKTGTITEGKIEVENVITSLKSDNHQLIIQLAGSLERFSEHPIGKAIYQYAKKQKLKFFSVDNFQAKTGFGVEGKIKGQKIYVGKLIDENQDFQEAILEKEKGKTVVYVYQKNKLLGAIVITDKIKKEAKETIDKLKNIGYQIFLLTGDNKKTALSTGEKTGIKKQNIFYEVLPHQKKQIIEKLKLKNKKVIFVGDGINDAPSLISADIGIAMGSGTDIAIESGQVIIMNNDLKKIINLINLSKQVSLIIKQNFFWAFVYNVFLIPLAMMGKINPILASLAMAMSSLSVVLNSLRLKIKKI